MRLFNTWSNLPTEARGAYWLVWPRGKSRDPSLCRFRDWLATQAQPDPN